MNKQAMLAVLIAGAIGLSALTYSCSDSWEEEDDDDIDLFHSKKHYSSSVKKSTSSKLFTSLGSSAKGSATS